MLALILAALAGTTAGPDTAVEICRPALARQAGGEISTIDVQSSSRRASGLILFGRLTVFLGMGQPAPGSASAHHLIRAEFTFRCTIRRHQVVRVSVAPAAL